MERERFVIVRLYPALNGDCEGEHPHFRPQPGGQLVRAPFAPGGAPASAGSHGARFNDRRVACGNPS